MSTTTNNTTNNSGEKLREMLTAARMSQRKAAFSAGLQPGTVNGLCQGARPSVQTATRLCAVLGVEPAEIWADIGAAGQVRL